MCHQAQHALLFDGVLRGFEFWQFDAQDVGAYMFSTLSNKDQQGLSNKKETCQTMAATFA